jgi:Uma2 family endonuclease
MTIAASPPKTYTAEEYLAQEVESEVRSEFRSGEIIEMAGGTPAHNELIRSLTVIFSAGLRRKPYQIFLADQRLWLPERDLYTYPDMMVTPKPVVLKPGRKDTVMDPILVAEVLSTSTRSYDRDEKFEAYRAIATFQEYLMVDQYRVHVEHYVKQGENQWLFTQYQDLTARLQLSSVPVEIALAELYEEIQFEAAAVPGE